MRAGPPQLAWNSWWAFCGDSWNHEYGMHDEEKELLDLAAGAAACCEESNKNRDSIRPKTVW